MEQNEWYIKGISERLDKIENAFTTLLEDLPPEYVLGGNKELARIYKILSPKEVK